MPDALDKRPLFQARQNLRKYRRASSVFRLSSFCRASRPQVNWRLMGKLGVTHLALLLPQPKLQLCRLHEVVVLADLLHTFGWPCIVLAIASFVPPDPLLALPFPPAVPVVIPAPPVIALFVTV
ncbi:hypothetical protein BJY59DRAFT_408632 [Rhodotorula toruloides]